MKIGPLAHFAFLWRAPNTHSAVSKTGMRALPISSDTDMVWDVSPDEIETEKGRVNDADNERRTIARKSGNG